VQSMARSDKGSSGITETIVGANRDPNFGSAIMVGLGGIFVELLHDVSLELAPLSPMCARGMIRGLRTSKLLYGFRGRPEADTAALEDLLVHLSALCEALGEKLVSIDLNPVMVLPKGEGVRIVDIVMQVAPAPSHV
ncbi:MAG: acetate--CoA ligase family protein, partial [Mailhella sp.]|nr:acetate--CoA ligase family protein [Mailhella sp.]